jgi:hypothetical protein
MENKRFSALWPTIRRFGRRKVGILEIRFANLIREKFSIFPSSEQQSDSLTKLMKKYDEEPGLHGNFI